MEQSIAGLLQDTFSEMSFEQHLDDDTVTENRVNVPQNESDTDSDNNHTESSGSECDFEWTNKEEQTKYGSENISSEEQSMMAGSMLCASQDDSNSDKNKMHTQNQQLSLYDEESRENNVKIHSDIKQVEYANMQEMGLPKETHYDLEIISSESGPLSYQIADEPEDKSSTLKEERMEPENIEEHVQDEDEFNPSSGTLDWPVTSLGVYRNEMKEFTEEDHEREGEGLADYPSDLSHSDSKGHEDVQPNHVDSKLVEELEVSLGCSYGIKNLEEPPISSENFQSYLNESYTKETPDYYGENSIDGDLSLHTILEEQSKVLMQQELESATYWESIDREVMDVVVAHPSQNLEICDVDILSSIPGSSRAGMETFLKKKRIESELLSSDTVTDNKNQKHNSEHSDVSDTGEIINTLLPGTFWSLMDDDNLMIDEYDWDINGEELICDEEEFQQELEDNEQETQRDWTQEKARIDAFNEYYQTVEGEEKGRSHKVMFCLEPETSLYEDESDGSEEQQVTIESIREVDSLDSSAVKQDQSNNEYGCEVSDSGEDISNFLMDDHNIKLDEYDHDNVGDFYKTTTCQAICDDDDDFLEKLKIEIEMDIKKERARTENVNPYYDASVKDEQNEEIDTVPKVMLKFNREYSQDYEDRDSSEQESITDDDAANIQKTEDQSDSDEALEKRSYTGRHRYLPKGLQKMDKELKKRPKRNKCLVLLRSVLALGLATTLGLLSYWVATDSLDWIY